MDHNIVLLIKQEAIRARIRDLAQAVADELMTADEAIADAVAFATRLGCYQEEDDHVRTN